ncbi:late competence development ComFB family protein [Marinomonas fungiae]|uniref:Late competence development protein ComFB n=1 Tax=Marinomonas fungiae TaxID=1137284 RepID=A0A0K6IK92_9GAMM|nr:late competence development ComFB family protein [Marinomonas fungiae]CUB03524.1 Late competence development protein ComFB [Marinomonas fungiae]
MSIADDIHNYYEKLLFEHLEANGLLDRDPNYLADLCCIVLNHLPTKYVRHDVDTAFFLTRAERARMDIKVNKALKDALEYLEQENANS